MTVGVLVQLASKNIDKTFDYLVPKEKETEVAVGKRVQVPFGKQLLEGFILKVDDQTPSDLKAIIEVVDEEVILNQELLALGKKMQQQTLANLILCYQVMLPKALKAKQGVAVNKKYQIYYERSNKEVEKESLNASQRRLLECFTAKKQVLKKTLTALSESSLKTLVKKGILIECRKEQYRYTLPDESYPVYPLTKDQQRVVGQVQQKKEEAQTFLLHGVTGSGKTEVYMELIEKVLKEGKTSILLVPEISLTPQVITRFQSRFQGSIAVLHSGLSDGEKYDEWRKIVRGEVSIVIGARSAIFAPLKRIGMIIIDEAHSSTYQQENNPKYNAIMIAKERSKYHHCPLLLGSATPSLEMYARAKKKVYTLLELPKRVNQRPLPKVSIIDMNQEGKKGHYPFSESLIAAIKERLEKKEQVMLLLNRRGYASFISCQNCGYVEKCPNCDITLTFHKSSQMLRCHYCGYATKQKTICPECHEASLQNLGMGTEKVEEKLQELFPIAKILRMDVDTTTTKGSHGKMIAAFASREYDILLGTQMIAKGLDFKDVTLVGVINADTSLNIPDFRSSEATFQLLDQVSGRSGRGAKEGKVIIQTFNPDHYAIMYAKRHDYLGFYETEMRLRHHLKYPPYYYLAYVRIFSKHYEEASKDASKIKKYLQANLKSSILLGPSMCSVFKVNNIYRFGIIIKYKQEEHLYPCLKELLEHYKANRNIQLDVDFNPLHL